MKKDSEKLIILLDKASVKWLKSYLNYKNYKTRPIPDEFWKSFGAACHPQTIEQYDVNKSLELRDKNGVLINDLKGYAVPKNNKFQLELCDDCEPPHPRTLSCKRCNKKICDTTEYGNYNGEYGWCYTDKINRDCDCGRKYVINGTSYGG